ncbi:hypothetical protein ACLOJK_014805 [Asimina triloba]
MPRNFLVPSSPWLLRDVLRDLPLLFTKRVLAEIEVCQRQRGLRVEEYLLLMMQLSADTVLRSAAKPIAFRERRVVEEVVLDNDDDSGGTSSVGQHVPTGNADDHQNKVSKGLSRRDGSGGTSIGPMSPLDINVNFIEPFRELIRGARASGSVRPRATKWSTFRAPSSSRRGGSLHHRPPEALTATVDVTTVHRAIGRRSRAT